ncbi:conserved hypothetical protein [Ricinus communis]|uniref:Uncharacterized protein n=1 Tax=Ricinus communis TaxID=3988 RepID=B9SFK2_RICCO|nr:conserved hypothetical protein [Ricinus communis]
MSGRPKKNRRKGKEEVKKTRKISRSGRIMTCGVKVRKKVNKHKVDGAQMKSKKNGAGVNPQDNFTAAELMKEYSKSKSKQSNQKDKEPALNTVNDHVVKHFSLQPINASKKIFGTKAMKVIWWLCNWWVKLTSLLEITATGPNKGSITDKGLP